MLVEPSSKLARLLLFFISPVLGLISVLKYPYSKVTYFIFFNFCVYFALMFDASSPTLYLDCSRYYALFNETCNINWNTFKNQFGEYLTFQSVYKDFAINTLAFIISRLTSNFHIFWGVIAAIFSLFYIGSLKILMRMVDNKQSLFVYVLLFLFTVSNPIFNINGARFWVSAWIFVWLIFKIILEDRYKLILFLFLIPFIHLSFLICLFIFATYFFVNKQRRFLSIFLFLSMFIGLFFINVLESVSNYLPVAISDNMHFYTDSQYITDINSNVSNSNFMYFVNPCLIIVRNIWIFSMYRKGLKMNLDTRTYKMLIFTVIMAIFCNIFIFIPSLGSRFALILVPFLIYLSLSIIKLKDFSRFIVYIYFIINILNVYILYENMSIVLNSDFIYSNYIFVLFDNLLN